MKKACEKTIAAIVCCLIAGLVFTCGNAPVAGGAGTGNPGKTTFGIVVEEDTCCVPPALLKALRGEDVSITDADSNEFDVTGSFIIVKRIHFNVEPKEKERLAEVTVLEPLRKDAGSVVLDGPYTFNTITGAVEPPIEPFMLPDMNYKSVKLVISNGPSKNSVYLQGTFSYNDSIHNFCFDLSLNTEVTYESSSAFYISGQDSTDLRIALDASLWLADVYTDACIGSRSDPFDSTDTFILDGKITDTTCTMIPQKIKDNIVRSGKLKVKQVKAGTAAVAEGGGQKNRAEKQLPSEISTGIIIASEQP